MDTLKKVSVYLENASGDRILIASVTYRADLKVTTTTEAFG